jgi:hypothetical protein
MRLRGLFTAFSAMLLLAAMFVAVHRGAQGREIAERLGRLEVRQAAADMEREELESLIVHLGSRPRIERAAKDLGLHTPSEDELVVLDLTGMASGSPEGAP